MARGDQLGRQWRIIQTEIFSGTFPYCKHVPEKIS
jgi:hypothetical protein